MKLSKENQVKATTFLAACYATGHLIGKRTIENDKDATAPAAVAFAVSVVLCAWVYRGIKAQKAAELK